MLNVDRSATKGEVGVAINVCNLAGECTHGDSHEMRARPNRKPRSVLPLTAGRQILRNPLLCLQLSSLSAHMQPFRRAHGDSRASISPSSAITLVFFLFFSFSKRLVYFSAGLSGVLIE